MEGYLLVLSFSCFLARESSFPNRNILESFLSLLIFHALFNIFGSYTLAHFRIQAPPHVPDLQLAQMAEQNKSKGEFKEAHKFCHVREMEVDR